MVTTVIGTARNDVWALGTGGKAWHWNGTTWTAVDSTSPAEYPLGAYAVDPKNIWAVGSHGFGWHYDGTSWTSTQINPTGNQLLGVFATSASNVYAMGGNGDLLHYDGTWQARSSGFSASVTAMWGISDHDLWVFTDDKNARHFDGSHWTVTALPGIAYSATGTSGTDVWVGSDAGLLYHYDGASWKTVTTADTKARIYGIYIAAPDRVVLAGDPTVQFWDGARYTVALTPVAGARTVWGSGPSDIWVGIYGTCATYHFNGASWTQYPFPGCGAIWGIHGTSSSDVYFVGDGTGMPRHWDGSKFTSIAIGATGIPLAVYATPTRVFFTTDGGEVITGLGTSWSKVASIGDSMSSILGWSADKVWVGGGDGYLLSYKP